ncbi:MAG: HAMP domain-containing histidine kinase [Bacteroidales bacterium]|nr:HAMP domain-containing histidine kinase [Bacteroidales bacterium]
MRKRSIYIIILVSSVALLGTIAIEYFWIRKIMRYQQEQFTGSVNVALKTVSNRLYDMRQDSIELLFDKSSNGIISDTELELTHSLIQQEFSSLDISSNYAYGIYDSQTGKIYTQSKGAIVKKLKNSQFNIPLTCPRRSDRFYLTAYFPNRNAAIREHTLTWLIFAAVFIIILIGTFSIAIILLFKQKKLSAMKTDFVNNLTHEFKTPISTISLASEMLLNGGHNGDKPRIKRYAKIIFDENARLQSQVERVLQIAVLDKGDFKLKKKPVDIHEILETVIQSFNIIVQRREGKILSCLEANQTSILADRVHLLNIFSNLFDNANKYSPEKPVLRVSTKNQSNGILITIGDRGIGISDENQHHVFKNLYRVPTGDLHDVKGFGMGLYYVKRVVEAHGGTIKLKSELGKGSRFKIYLPFDQEEQHSNEQKHEKANTPG